MSEEFSGLLNYQEPFCLPVVTLLVKYHSFPTPYLIIFLNHNSAAIVKHCQPHSTPHPYIMSGTSCQAVRPGIREASDGSSAIPLLSSLLLGVY